MPYAYFKCECGKESRQIVPIDHSQDTFNERTRRWDFDASKPRAPLHPHTHACECGLTVLQSADPKAVPSKFLFNYFSEDA